MLKNNEVYLEMKIKMKNKILLAVRALIAATSVGMIIWYLMPLRVRVINIGNVLGVFIFLCLAAAMMFLTPIKKLLKKARSKKPLRYATNVLAALLVMFGIYFGIVTVLMTGVAMRAPSRDATVVVLGCKVNGTKPSLMLEKRLEAAKEYLNDHPNAVCVVSGGKGYNEGISEAQCMYEYLTQNGIAPERIYTEDQSTTTKENFEFSKKIIEENGLNKNIAIVTDGFHELRANIIAQEVGLTATGSVSADTPSYMLATYHMREIVAIGAEIVL